MTRIPLRHPVCLRPWGARAPRKGICVCRGQSWPPRTAPGSRSARGCHSAATRLASADATGYHTRAGVALLPSRAVAQPSGAAVVPTGCSCEQGCGRLRRQRVELLAEGKPCGPERLRHASRAPRVSFPLIHLKFYASRRFVRPVETLSAKWGVSPGPP